MATERDVTAASVRSRPTSAFQSVMIVTARLGVIAALTTMVAGCEARTYSAAAIAARVVDSVSGAPIEGVIAVAAWQARGGLEGGNVTGYVNLVEAMSDANGALFIPAWGPRKWSDGAIRDAAPMLILFKRGYEVAYFREEKRGLHYAPSRMTSSWDGKSLPLARYAGSAQEYSDRLFGLDIRVDSLVRDSDCGWRAIPRFLLELDRLHHALAAEGVTRNRVPSLDHLTGRGPKSCGSLKDYVLGAVR